MDIVEFMKTRGAIDFFNSQPVKKAYLFGSFSRNEDTPESDIDILVDLDKSVTLFQFISMQRSLEKMLEKKVDLVSSNGLSPRLRPYIEREKLLIYEKQNQ
ncbi:MAG: nucleotidyltransferase family protein [Bacteroidetes bacterium]|nr:nucleotidyltransferase family protein [Bacteroidota bacterium]